MYNLQIMNNCLGLYIQVANKIVLRSIGLMNKNSVCRLKCFPYCHNRNFASKETTLNLPSVNISTKNKLHGDSIYKKFIKSFKFKFLQKPKLQFMGSLLYTKLDEKVDIPQFFRVCLLPDTFYSWYLVTELHVWLLCVRLMAEGDFGRFIRNSLIEAMYLDVEQRAKELGSSVASVRRKQTYTIQDEFAASMMAYDEGLSGSDQKLASAIWTCLFLKHCDDPERLECVVHYIRRNLSELDKTNAEDLLNQMSFQFKPLLEPEQLRES